MPTPLKRLADRIHQRIDRTERHRPEWRKGQVTSVDPLRVDGVRAGNVSGRALGVDTVVWMQVGHGRRQVAGVIGEATPLSVAQFGAKGDGSTDDTSAIQAAADEAKRIHVPDGTYRVTSPITVGSRSHIDLAPGAVLDGSEMANGDHLLSARGDLTDETDLSSDASRGDTTIDVTDGSAFAPRDVIFIASDAEWLSGTEKGEYQVVRSVSGNTLTLQDGLFDDYATVDNGRVYLLDAVRDVTVSGGRMVSAVDATNTRMIEAAWARDVRIRDVTFEDVGGRAVEFTGVVWASVLGCNFKAIGESGSGTAYGVALRNGCQWIDVADCHGSDLRHLVSAGGGSISPTGLNRNGINRKVTVANNTVYGARSAAIDSHVAGESWTIVGNVVSAGNGDSADGIIFQGRDVAIVGNTIVQPTRHGIFWQLRANVRNGAATIEGNTIVEPASMGVAIDNEDGDSCVGVSVVGNTVRDAGGEGIYVQTSGGGQFLRFTIGNNALDCTGMGIRLRANGGRIADGTVVGNTVNNDTVGIRFSDDGGGFERVIANANLVHANDGDSGGDGIEGVGSPTDCWIDGNLVIGSITGFDSGDVGTNKTL